MRTILLSLLAAGLLGGCAGDPPPPPPPPSDHTAAVTEVLQLHLAAVAARDFDALAATLDPDGEMTLILPGQENTYRVADFLDFHAEWFRDSSWTFGTEVLRTTNDDRLATAIVAADYREPERDGVPYRNQMMITYTLERRGPNWYVTQDHASSVRKSTD